MRNNYIAVNKERLEELADDSYIISKFCVANLGKTVGPKNQIEA